MITCLLQLHVLYEALESELEANRDHPLVSAIHFPDELNRLGLLEQDLDYYYDKQWRHLLDGDDVTVGMRRYAARIREVGRHHPELLVAHSYTRYLGDMSGGQILRRLIKKRYSLPEDAGVSFYCFDHVQSIAAFKQLYSTRMNGLDLSESEMDQQVEEAQKIFQHNIDVFEEVGAMFKPAAPAAATADKDKNDHDVADASPVTTSEVSDPPTAQKHAQKSPIVRRGSFVNEVTKAKFVTVATFLMGVSVAVLTGMYCPWVHGDHAIASYTF